MNPENFKQYLVRDKEFLERLYSSSVPNAKRQLNQASDSKLNTLVQLIHFICNGEIKIKKEHFENMPKRLILFMRKNFEKKTKTRTIVSGERLPKLKLLHKLAPILQELLYPLFNEN